ncbi:hypothetical protein DFQ28_002079 [Apophysomyces sp. BC1034]|nr:hypothetical protein DFQ30_002488 [Apophysomyces sp. BC1015]KAG0179875.1 hypothetical protein DFQ29_001528 [Apophysomyces sp. BC1021]KAG0190410.1 hypothetical protein DFQ28_002079 [Apophysomyces sp. BC1034]
MATAVKNPSEPYCPQRKDITHETIDPVVRRLSEESARMHRLSSRAGMVAQPNTEDERALADRLKTLDMFQALRHGKFPNNQKLYEFLDKMIDSPSIEQRKSLMSEDGQLLLNDFSELLKSVKKTIQTKNADELFQSLFYHLHNLHPPAVNQDQTAEIQGGVNTEQMKEEAKRGAESLWKIGHLILLNGEFRTMVREMVELAQDIFGDAATKVSGMANEAGQTVQSAGQMINEKAQAFGDQAQKFSDQAQSMADPDKQNEMMDKVSQSDQFKYHKDGILENLRQTKKMTTDNNNEAVLVPHTNLGTGAGMNLANETKGGSSMDTWQQKSEDMKENTKRKGKQIQENFKDQVSMGQTYLHDKFPPEKQEELIKRLKKVLYQVQQHSDYQRAIDIIIDLFQSWGDRLVESSQGVGGTAADATKQIQSDSDWSNAIQEAKTIIEDWAQGRSLDSLIESFQKNVTDMKNDNKLREYYDEVAAYMHKLLKEPGYVNAETSTTDGKKLIEKGRETTQGRYRDHINKLLDEGRTIMTAMAEDPMALEIEDRFKQIHQNLWYDRDGNVAFKPHLLNDMRLTLLPAMLEQIKLVPIPHIEYSDDQFDVAVENVILSGDTLMPSTVEVKMENYACFSPVSDLRNVDQQAMFIRMSQIQAVINDVVFYYKRKSGFPRISDRGVATLILGGKGMDISMRVCSNSSDKDHTFSVTQCQCHIDNLKVKIHDSRHNLLYKTMHPMVIGIVRRQIAKAIEKKITAMLLDADKKLTSVLYRKNRELAQQDFEEKLANQGLKQDTQPSEPATTNERRGIVGTIVAIMNHNIKSKMINKKHMDETCRDRLYSPTQKTPVVV